MTIVFNITISIILIWNNLLVPPMCKCNVDPPFSEVAQACPLIVVGEVVDYENSPAPQFMNVKIKYVLKGNNEKETIRIWGDNGKSCRPYVSQFPARTTWVFALHKDDQDYYYLSICGQYWLTVKNEQANGIIDKVGEQKTLSLQDLTNRFLEIDFRDSYQDFTEHLSNVKKGWTEKQLLTHAGEPDYKGEDVWFYRYQQGGLGCVRYAYYEFMFQNGKIADVRMGGGHKIIE